MGGEENSADLVNGKIKILTLPQNGKYPPTHTEETIMSVSLCQQLRQHTSPSVVLDDGLHVCVYLLRIESTRLFQRLSYFVLYFAVVQGPQCVETRFPRRRGVLC